MWKRKEEVKTKVEIELEICSSLRGYALNILCLEKEKFLSGALGYWLVY